jgi:hypothetical protein
LDFFYGGIVSCFLAETMVGANVWGSENQMESPNTRVTNRSTQPTKKVETKCNTLILINLVFIKIC